ncbi:MAG TPA: S9 family peptidase [Sphingomicrobium sp.]|nr:S9 family peptidase [Sphingomicrobium sp.]
MKFRSILLACAGLFVVTPAFGQEATPLSTAADPTLAAEAKAFGSREAVTKPSLSPDGSSVLYTTPGPGSKTYAVISNLVSGKTSILSSTEGADSLRWCDYASPQRIVCRVTGGVVDASGDILGFSRLVAMNDDGTDQKLLGQPESSFDAYVRQVDGSILDWKKRLDGSVLIERQYVPEAGVITTNIVRTKEGLGVDLINTSTLQSKPVELPNSSAADFMSDGRGNVRIMRVDEAKSSGTLTGRVKYFYRSQGSRDWKTLADYVDSEQQMQPLAVDADADCLYALKKNDGRFALYAIKLDGSGSETLIAANPQVDIDDVVRVGTGLKVIGYTYADESRHAIYFDPEFKELAASLGKALPKLPLIDFVDSSADGRKLLIFASSDTDPGRYYLFDRDTKTLNEAMLDRPALEGRTLAEVKPVTVTGSDGAQIPAYLTLPPGKEAKGLPAVILPHGGPTARDEWGFDWLPQFLAARGYAVLQPEYRGSAGYGDTWLNVNGFKNWRTSMGDIAASTRWLAAQGIADPKRIAIVGWSYGGYAALMEAETDPSLYKAVVAIAPVTDLQSLKEDSAPYTNARVVEDFVGSGPHILEGSPLRHTNQIQVPVLLAHGDLDQNVRFSESQKMASALKGAGKQVEFVEYKGLDHQLNDSVARTDLLIRAGELLDRTIGH